MRELHANWEELQKEIAEAMKEHGCVQSECISLSEQLGDARLKLTGLKASKVALSTKLDTEEQEIAELKANITTHEAPFAEQRKKRENLCGSVLWKVCIRETHADVTTLRDQIAEDARFLLWRVFVLLFM